MQKANSLLTGTLLAASLLAGSALSFSTAAHAEDERIKENFKLTHASVYGEWEIFCGNFGSAATESCNLRFTTIYNPRPDLRASIWFLQPDPENTSSSAPLVLDMGFEAVSLHLGGGIEGSGGYEHSLARCVYGSCRLEGQDLRDWLDALLAGQDLTVRFSDYGYQSKTFIAPSEGFAEAWEQFRTQLETRDLLPDNL
ncbi:hypothetical protein [Kiloniella sp. b19]|uniref:hypothetical protein n=1 Tax=Kiloniella sp. GXU_MW_B19 TaxID=3141326 RepID=UPI0031D41D92